MKSVLIISVFSHVANSDADLLEPQKKRLAALMSCENVLFADSRFQFSKVKQVYKRTLVIEQLISNF